MKIREEIRKCVVYFGRENEDGSFYFGGTAFLIARNMTTQNFTHEHHFFVVTAKHNVQKLKSENHQKAVLRINTKDGGSTNSHIDLDKWIFHDDANVDLAIAYFYLKPEYDVFYIHETLFLTDGLMADNEIEIGDEIFITGLFSRHKGKDKNIPIVRIGNICAMPEEKVQIAHIVKGHDDLSMDAYLIEARSTSGLSGSPVFTNLGVIRKMGGIISVKEGVEDHFLLGVICAHFSYFSDVIEPLNTGIAAVTPVSKLFELLNQKNVRTICSVLEQILESPGGGTLKFEE